MSFWNSLAFSMIQQMLAIWPLIPLPFLNVVCTSPSFLFTYWWSLALRILSLILLASKMSAIVWELKHSFALPFFRIGMKIDLFQSCGHCWVFQIHWHIEYSTLGASYFKIWSQFSSVTQLCLTLQPQGRQHARPPCASPTPRACSNSWPSTR